MTARILILGIFVADTVFRASRQPRMGETLLGESFRLGPGGKGSNQAVAAARAGGQVHFISRLGRDTFAEMALATWREAGVVPEIIQPETGTTGAASIFVDRATGNNAIIVVPGVAGDIDARDITRNAGLFKEAALFMTQLEQPLDAALFGLKTARAHGLTTILNPAPAADLPAQMLKLCDYITPNETEAEALTGIPVASPRDAARAATALLASGVGAAIITLGERGAFYDDGTTSTLVPAVAAGPVVDTTGAGDAFNGAFAAALADGQAPLDAVRFGCIAAGISVTRPGAAAASPTLAEIRAQKAMVQNR